MAGCFSMLNGGPLIGRVAVTLLEVYETLVDVEMKVPGVA